jgi:two-component system CheB/CheR fusion protein
MRLRQIILNLISNAVKFTSKGKVVLSVQLLDEDTEKMTVEFMLTDTGIGIPEDRIHTIFDNFEQATNHTSRVYGGTGLGLATVKQLVELQGGKLFVSSEVGKGSTFGFVLDFQKIKIEMNTTIPVPTNKKPKPKNLNVLVVEDMALNQILIKIILEDFGFECDIADNGLLAIEKLQKNSYDVVLMDIQMPEMDGFEATKYIRTQMKSQIPIIALTADITELDIEKSEAAGMNDYIPKPIDEKLLYDKIMEYAGKSKNKKS